MLRVLGAVALLAFGVAGCTTDGGAVRTAAVAGAPRVVAPARPAERDHDALVAAFGGEYRAPELKAVLDAVVTRLAPATEPPSDPPEATVLDSPKVNAFALPSGRLYITRGLLALASDEAEVAAVVAHELAHVTLRHAAARGEAEARSALLGRVAVDVLGDGAAGAAIRERSRTTLAGFSREQELQADAAGIAALARAGYDPFAAARFLRALGREAALDREEPAGDAVTARLSTHPATSERVRLAAAAARRIGGEGSGESGRGAYLSALSGTAYGDRPSDGMIRGRAFLHPRLGVALEAPDGMALENMARALLGTRPDGRTRLLFDAVAAPEGQNLQELLAASWTDAIEPGSLATRLVGGRAVAFAASHGRDWTFRLAAVRIGPTTFRLILAGRGADRGADLERALAGVLESLRELGTAEAAALRPQRIVLAEAGPGDTAEGFARRMATDRALPRFLLLNGLEPGARLRPGERYKLVSD